MFFQLRTQSCRAFVAGTVQPLSNSQSQPRPSTLFHNDTVSSESQIQNPGTAKVSQHQTRSSPHSEQSNSETMQTSVTDSRRDGSHIQPNLAPGAGAGAARTPSGARAIRTPTEPESGATRAGAGAGAALSDPGAGAGAGAESEAARALSDLGAGATRAPSGRPGAGAGAIRVPSDPGAGATRVPHQAASLCFTSTQTSPGLSQTTAAPHPSLSPMGILHHKLPLPSIRSCVDTATTQNTLPTPTAGSSSNPKRARLTGPGSTGSIPIHVESIPVSRSAQSNNQSAPVQHHPSPQQPTSARIDLRDTVRFPHTARNILRWGPPVQASIANAERIEGVPSAGCPSLFHKPTKHWDPANPLVDMCSCTGNKYLR